MKKKLIAIVLVFLSGACSAVQPPYSSSYSCSVVEHKLVDNSYFQLLWSRSGIAIYPGLFTPLMQGVDSTVFVVTGQDAEYGASKILALETKSGNVLWKRDVVLPTSIITSSSQLYTGLYNKIEVVDPQTGGLVKSIEVPNVGFIFGRFISESNLHALTKSGRWLTYNIDDGTYSLSEPFLPYTPFLIENGVMYLYEGSELKGKEIETQSILWTYSINEDFDPIFTDDMIIISGQMGKIYALDKRTGNLLWNADAHAISNLATNGTQIYLLTNDGYLKVLDMNNGQEIAQLEFSPASFEPNSPPSGNIIGAYNLWVDSANDILTVSFGDSCQLMGFQLRIP